MIRGDRPLAPAARFGLAYLVLWTAWVLLFGRLLSVLPLAPDAIVRLRSLEPLLLAILSTAYVALIVHRGTRRAREAELRLRERAERAAVGIYVVRDGRFVYANAALASIFGYTPREMTASVRVARCVAPPDRELLVEDLRRCQLGEAGGIHYHLTGVRKDGETVRVEALGVATEWGGRPATLGVMLDMTELTWLQEQAALLTGAVTHELHNLLTGVAGGLALGLGNLRPDEPARTELEHVQRMAERAAELAWQLLPFSRRHLLHAAPLDANQELERMLPALLRLCGERMSIELDLERPIPAISMSSAHFGQVIPNLVVNAREATGGDGLVTIRTAHLGTGHPGLRQREGLEPGAHVVVSVSDNGCGMAPEMGVEAFEPFYTTKEDGTGLGLSTVYGIVTGAGGFVRVNSEPGKGSDVGVYLPVVGAEAERAVEAWADGNGRPPPERSRTGVLLVESDDVLRRRTASVLRRLGYRVLEAGSGRRAADLARERDAEIHLLVTALEPADPAGREVVAILRRQDPDRPIVYTAAPGSGDAVGTSAGEEVLLLEKPYDVHRLARAVQDALNREPRRAALHGT